MDRAKSISETTNFSLRLRQRPLSQETSAAYPGDQAGDHSV
jgi:hypothetical protein